MKQGVNALLKPAEMLYNSHCSQCSGDFLIPCSQSDHQHARMLSRKQHACCSIYMQALQVRCGRCDTLPALCSAGAILSPAQLDPARDPSCCAALALLACSFYTLPVLRYYADMIGNSRRQEPSYSSTNSDHTSKVYTPTKEATNNFVS